MRYRGRPYLAVVSAEGTVELPVGEIPSIHEPDGMGPNVLEQLHDVDRTSELDLSHGAGGGGEEFRSLRLEGVESPQAEELLHELDTGRAELLASLVRLQSGVEVLDDEVLRVSLG